MQMYNSLSAIHFVSSSVNVNIFLSSIACRHIDFSFSSARSLFCSAFLFIHLNSMLFFFTVRLPGLKVDPFLFGSGEVLPGIPDINASPPKVRTNLFVVYISLGFRFSLILNNSVVI